MTTELQQRLDALEARLDDRFDDNRQLSAELKAIRAELEAQLEPEWPQKGDEYWWADSASYLHSSLYGNLPESDATRQATDNMHRTREEAEAANQWYVENSPRLRAERIVLTRLKELGGGEFVFDEWNYHPQWNNDNGMLCLVSQTHKQSAHDSWHAPTKEIWQQVIDELGEDIVKQAMGIE